MKNSGFIFIFLAWICFFDPYRGWGQEIPVTTEQQLENQADGDQFETEDDSYLLELVQFKKNPINLNTADAEELKLLRIVTDLQIANLISYRKLFGKLITIYELQGVPAWDLVTIQKILPYVTTATPVSLTEEAGKRFRQGDHSLLLRLSQVLEKSAGFKKSSPGTKFLGSPQKIFFRYRYTYKNLVQFGLVGDKDAGERFLRGKHQTGFDFYSFHFFVRKTGSIQSLALGDFTVNMGQGLIQWQGLAFKKSAEVMGVKRQSAVLRPYNSAGEFYFHRGVGVSLKKRSMELTAFFSIRKLGGNFVADSVNNENYISSFFTSGYHRTPGENADRNNLTQTTLGGNFIYRGDKWQVGVNGIYYKFSLPIQKRDEPYNLYAINGKQWYNFSVDYCYTYKNLHFFGEAALDKNFSKAFINGILMSVDPRVDISFIQRTISKSYQSINGNAFTENSNPTNETGFYTGMVIRPAKEWRIDLYGDVIKFPWLKYGADAPANGIDLLVQTTYTPNKQVEVFLRFRNETKQFNQPGNQPVGQAGNSATNFLVTIPRQSWRTQVNYQLNSSLTLRNRVELLWYDHKARPDDPFGRGVNRENGFLTFFDIIYKPLLSPHSGILRLQYFETGGYNSRIYAYENDVMFSYSIPSFAYQGIRYYLTLNYDVSKRISFWIRWAQTIFRNQKIVGSGLDEIQGNFRTDMKLQALIIL